MSVLEKQQQALLEAVFGPWSETALSDLATQDEALRLRGLRAYRSNGHALAQRALAAAYPVLVLLLGEENFGALARAFWRQHPPARGDMAQWGDALPGFIAQAPQLAQEPYLADVARIEWALHRAATAANAQADMASFALLLEADPATTTLSLADGTCLVDSPWPVVSIVNAHLTGAPDPQLVIPDLIRDPSLREDPLPDGRHGLRVEPAMTSGWRAENALVWRQGFKPMLREAAPAETAFLTALLGNQSLSVALETDPAFDFNAWLAPAVQSGLVTGAVPLST